MRDRLAIVIVSYEAREHLARCLRSIAKNAPPFPVSVIVVDNASRDGSPEMVRSEFPDVTLIANQENRGFGPACNQGWRASDSDHVLLLNSDTEVLPGSLEGMVNALDARPRSGVLTPLVVDGRGEVIQMSWGWEPLFWGEILQKTFSPRALERSRWRRALVRRLQRRECRAAILCGAALLVRREALEQVGGMDEGYVFYLEDSDLCTRLRKAGWLATFHPGESIVHHLGKSSASQPARAALLFHQSQLLYYRRHGSALDRLLVGIYLRLRFWRAYLPTRELEAREFHRKLRGVLAGRERIAL
ncbi:MAG TPA: glycosyltransferase family 2 protein [Terriglobales bacterium]|nr:glycosyltransferase family 2 protein [Terriglobales bacterium]